MDHQTAETKAGLREMSSVRLRVASMAGMTAGPRADSMAEMKAGLMEIHLAR